MPPSSNPRIAPIIASTLCTSENSHCKCTKGLAMREQPVAGKVHRGSLPKESCLG